jgi:hypothetical protein
VDYFDNEDYQAAENVCLQVTVGQFPTCTMSVVAEGEFLKVLIDNAASQVRRVTWIPLSDDDAYDCSPDLKVC